MLGLSGDSWTSPRKLNAGVAELADAQDLKSWVPQGACGFDSHPRDYSPFGRARGLNRGEAVEADRAPISANDHADVSVDRRTAERAPDHVGPRCRAVARVLARFLAVQLFI